MRGRIWLFAALVAAALALHFAALSSKVAQSGEDNVRAHLALSSSALRTQLDLIDARLAPRLLSLVPEVVEATRVPADGAEVQARPDERALRAASAVLSPEPDLLAVVNKQGAVVSRHGKGTQAVDLAALPLARAALEGNPAPAFAMFDGSVYRLAAAHIPGNPAGAVVGTLLDDRFAAQLRTQVDADVTLVQAGKVLASSLPAGEARNRLLRWAAAPSAGYGELEVQLPGVGNRLSGKLPVRASHLAVRGALMQLDSGVQAALTVPAAPYLGWLARYQVYYALAFAVFLLFSLVWGLLARAPVPAPAPLMALPADDSVGPVKRHPRHEPLLGTDVGEGRTAPPPTDDVPWSASDHEPASVVVAPELAAPQELEPAPEWNPPAAAEPAQEWEAAPAPAAHATESLDPDVPPGAEASLDPDLPPASDPFAHPPEPQLVSAEEVGLRDAEPVKSPPPPPADASGEFSFAGLLDDARRAAHAEPALHGKSVPAGLEPEPAVAPEVPEEVAEAEPVPAAAAQAGPNGAGEEQPEPFPGDEPTRIEPVSAALLDKLRERDEELSQQARQQSAGAEQAAAATNGAAPGISEPEAPPEDPDEAHWRETYDKFRELKARLGEPADRITFEKFAGKLRKNREDLVAKHNCRGVRFSVYEKDGKAAIKASAIR